MIKEKTLPDVEARGATGEDAGQLTREKILGWMIQHRARHGTLPSRMSGDVDSAPGETWRDIEDALVCGRRGLPGGQHLGTLKSELITKPVLPPSPRLGVTIDKVTKEQIAEWMKAYATRHGHYPSNSSGQVEGTSNLSWFRIHTALMLGQRGLPGGQSLDELKQEFLKSGILPRL